MRYSKCRTFPIVNRRGFCAATIDCGLQSRKYGTYLVFCFEWVMARHGIALRSAAA